MGLWMGSESVLPRASLSFILTVFLGKAFISLATNEKALEIDIICKVR